MAEFTGAEVRNEAREVPASVAGEPVAIADLADELGTRKQTLFKIAKRLGIEGSKRRDPGRGNQLIAVVAAPDAASIRDEYSRASRQGETSVEGLPLAPDEGMFYVIQLEPEHDPGRFKVGFTTDLDGRIRHHRCSAPFAVYRRTWPCRRSWERAAIDCTTEGMDQLHRPRSFTRPQPGRVLPVLRVPESALEARYGRSLLGWLSELASGGELVEFGGRSRRRVRSGTCLTDP